ncbi:MAG: hypothetical protein E7262_03700 [Lachnospiraceae bacterium]|nr:hypothetical protein [Lachnospiraceae bacterium]
MYLYEEKVVFFILLSELIVTAIFLAMEVIGYGRMMMECEKGEKDSLVIKRIKDGNLNVNSVDNFVNKYVSNFKFCGLKLYTIKRICGQLLNFIFITWCIVSIYGIYLEVSIKDVLWTTMLGILVVGGLFSIGYSVDNLKYEYIAKVNLKNNLEEYIYFNDDNCKIIYDSLSNEVTHVKYVSENEQEGMHIPYVSDNVENGVNVANYNIGSQVISGVDNDECYSEEESLDIINLAYNDLMEEEHVDVKNVELDPVQRRERLKQAVYASDERNTNLNKKRNVSASEIYEVDEKSTKATTNNILMTSSNRKNLKRRNKRNAKIKKNMERLEKERSKNVAKKNELNSKNLGYLADY